MVAATSIILPFADGEYSFALKLPQIAELQRKCGAGIGAIYARLLTGANPTGESAQVFVREGAWFYEDVVETIRQGLIGGNSATVNGEQILVPATLANTLVNNYVDAAPVIDHWALAVAIMTAKIVGYTPPKAEAVGETATPTDETSETTA